MPYGASRFLLKEENFLTYQSSDIACTGHSSTQVPQSTQVSGSTFALSSIVIASTGQTSLQLPHPVHFSTSTFAAIGISFPYASYSCTSCCAPPAGIWDTCNLLYTMNSALLPTIFFCRNPSFIEKRFLPATAAAGKSLHSRRYCGFAPLTSEDRSVR